MTIHDIFRRISPIFRNRRFRTFLDNVKPKMEETILDVGGYPHTWTAHSPCAKSVDVLNLHEIPYDASRFPGHHIKTVIGNACALRYSDNSYNIVFSNSVIEHVGSWVDQQNFASEAQRVGRKLWIQTPAREFLWNRIISRRLYTGFQKTFKKSYCDILLYGDGSQNHLNKIYKK